MSPHYLVEGYTTWQIEVFASDPEEAKTVAMNALVNGDYGDDQCDDDPEEIECADPDNCDECEGD